MLFSGKPVFLIFIFVSMLLNPHYPWAYAQAYLRSKMSCLDEESFALLEQSQSTSCQHFYLHAAILLIKVAHLKIFSTFFLVLYK